MESKNQSLKLTETKIRSLIKVTGKSSDSKSLYGHCPWCGHAEFGISLEKDHQFNCFRKKNCGVTGNIFVLASKLGIDIGVGGLRETPPAKLRRLGDDTQGEIEKIENHYKLPLLFKRVFKNDYLETQRGFTEIDFKKYEVGHSPLLRDYVIFVIRENETPVGHVQRSIHNKEYCEENDIKRYKNSSGSLSRYLYGEVGTETILVEGIFDKRAVDIKLEKNCCATLGAKVSDHQIELLINGGCKEVVLCFDPDVTKIILKSAKKLMQYFNVSVMNLGNDDPDELNREDLAKCFINRQSFFNFVKINRYEL